MSEKLNKASEFRDFRDEDGLSLEDHLALEGKIPEKVIYAYLIEYFMFCEGESSVKEFARLNFAKNAYLASLLEQKLNEEQIS